MAPPPLPAQPKSPRSARGPGRIDAARPVQWVALAVAGVVGPATAALPPPAERGALQSRITAVRTALAAVAATPEAAAAGWQLAQASNWTNWPKWSKWSNWANK